MRSRGTLRPRSTFSRNGITSSIPSGPPNETTNKASYGMNELYQSDYVFHRRFGQNPMPQIEYVSRTLLRLIQDPPGLCQQHLSVGEQGHGIEITHHRH